MAIGGTALSALGSISEGESAYQSGVNMKKAEDYNASVLLTQAEAIQKSADLDIARQAKAARRLKSAQRAAYGKAGVLLEGSPTEVIVDSAAEAEMDMSITQFNADVEKRAKLSDASYRTYLGENYLAQGEQAQNMGYLKAGTTVLTAASSFATKYGAKKGK